MRDCQSQSLHNSQLKLPKGKKKSVKKYFPSVQNLSGRLLLFVSLGSLNGGVTNTIRIIAKIWSAKSSLLQAETRNNKVAEWDKRVYSQQPLKSRWGSVRMIRGLLAFKNFCITRPLEVSPMKPQERGNSCTWKFCKHFLGLIDFSNDP